MEMRGQNFVDKIRVDRRGLINWDRINKSILDNGLDAVVAVSPVNVTYMGGVLLETFKHYWLSTFVVTSADGNQGVVINEGDAGFFREYSWVKDIRTFRYVANADEGNRQAVRLLVDVLQNLGLAKGKIGIEKTHIPTNNWNYLLELLPSATLVDGGVVFEYARLIKTLAEIKVIREATLNTEKAIRAALSLTRSGDTDKDLANRIRGHMLWLGADALGTWTDIHSGESSTTAHSWPTARTMEQGEVVHIETGAFFGGYITGLACNAVVSDPQKRQQDRYHKIWKIKQECLARISPGSRASEIFKFTEEEYITSGLQNPWATVGHGIGLKQHEGFEITKNSNIEFETSMVFNISFNHIEGGDARYQVAEPVLVLNDGAEFLSRLTESENMHLVG